MRFKASLLFLAVCVLRLNAEPQEFPDHNFALERPKGWTEMSPLPPAAVFVWTNPDRSCSIVGAATKLLPKDRLAGPRDFIAGAKDGMTEKGAKLGGITRVTLANRPFAQFTGRMGGEGPTVAVYATAAGDTVYLIQTMSQRGDAATDPELKSVAASFRLLKPAPNLSLDGPPQPTRAGIALGMAIAAYIYWDLPSELVWTIKLLWI